MIFVRLLIVLCLSFLNIGSAVAAAECKRTGTQCVDAAACKMISGVQVCLANIGQSCWKWADTYTCLKPNAINYCQPFVNAQPRCWQTSTTCSKTDAVLGSGCMEETQTWRCDDSSMSAPANTVLLDDSYTLGTDTLNDTTCSTYKSNPRCTLAEHVCVEGPETRVVNGLPVTKDCWKWQDNYTCVSDTLASDCQPFIEQGCRLVDTQCVNTDDAGTCNLYDKTYSCETKPASSTTTQQCSSSFCSDGQCYDTSNSPDKDIGAAITMMEVLRQAGTYIDPETMRIFNGDAGTCRVRLFGMKNCCKSSGGGGSYSNGSMLGGVVSNAAGQAVRYGSYYVYDSLMGSGWLYNAVGAITGATAAAQTAGSMTAVSTLNPSLGMYGFSVSFGAAPVGATVLGNAGGMTFAFDPTSLAISIAITVVMQMMACEQDEQFLGMKRGQNLCHFLGSYCSKKVLGVCMEKKQSYCCFNSRLARIINEQGRSQLNISWGSAKAPKCEGFTIEQLQQLDFSQMDMSEFIEEIAPATVNVNQLLERNQGLVNDKVNNYYGQ